MSALPRVAESTHVKKIVVFGNHRIQRGIAGLVRSRTSSTLPPVFLSSAWTAWRNESSLTPGSRCCEKAAPTVKTTSASVERLGVSFVLMGLHLSERGIGARRPRTAGFISALRRSHIDAGQLPPRAFFAPQLTPIKAAVCARTMIDSMSRSSQSTARSIVVVC